MSQPYTKLNLPLEVREELFEVLVSNGGTFETTYQGKRYSATRLDDLREQLMKATKQHGLKLAVEFTTETGEDATITGIHAGTHAFLVRYASGTTAQKNPYDLRGKSLRRLNDAERAQLHHLIEAANTATVALTKFRREREIDVIATVNAIIRKEEVQP